MMEKVAVLLILVESVDMLQYELRGGEPADRHLKRCLVPLRAEYVDPLLLPLQEWTCGDMTAVAAGDAVYRRNWYI